MRWVFLAFAVWGTVHPMFYFVSWFQAHGWDIMAMVDAWHVNDATSGLVWDLTVAAAALTVWVVVEAVQTRQWLRLIAIPATFCIGVSCGLPLYLFFAPVADRARLNKGLRHAARCASGGSFLAKMKG